MSRPVEAAILSFTDVDDHRAFNAWHRYDHMPEQMNIEGVVAGQRLVATPDLLARRYVDDDTLTATRYFGYYLISSPVNETFKALGELYVSLNEQGRGFDRRGPSVGYRLRGMYASPRGVSSPAVMPFRPHQGVYVHVRDPRPNVPEQAMDADFARHEQTIVPRMLGLPGVAGCWSFEHAKSHGIPASAYQSPEHRTIQIYWLESDPAAFLDALALQAPSTTADDGSSACSTAFHCAYRFIPPDSAFDWFDDT